MSTEAKKINRESIDLNEVLVYFVAANMARVLENRPEGYNFGLDGVDAYIQIAASLHEEQLRQKFNTMMRWKEGNSLEMLLRLNWVRAKVSLDSVGLWPRIGDLPEDWCNGSVVKTAQRIADNPNIKGFSIAKIYEISKCAELVTNKFSPILVAGDKIEERINNNLERMTYHCFDGSHRCIGAARAGLDSITAFIGV